MVIVGHDGIKVEAIEELPLSCVGSPSTRQFQ
jgi:hypothetical protein